jgi:hypothetical protein
VHTPDEQAWERDDLFTEITVENVEADRAVRHSITLTLAICHPDLSEDIPLGTVYLRGSLRHLRQALAEEVSDILRDLEAGVSEENGATLSFTRDGSAIYRSPMARASVVRSRRQRRRAAQKGRYAS